MFLFFEANIQQFLAIKDHILEKKKEKQILFDDNHFHSITFIGYIQNFIINLFH